VGRASKVPERDVRGRDWTLGRLGPPCAGWCGGCARRGRTRAARGPLVVARVGEAAGGEYAARQGARPQPAAAEAQCSRNHGDAFTNKLSG
jgi:hypothetical protein